jgi:CheY-like chemotaxis protein
VTVRIVIADDQELIRTGFRMILAADPGIEVVAEAGTGSEAIRAARELHPDVVLMDIRMPDLDGIEATRRILAENGPRTQVLILTTFDLDEYVYEALRGRLCHSPAHALVQEADCDYVANRNWGTRATAARKEGSPSGVTERRIFQQTTVCQTAATGQSSLMRASASAALRASGWTGAILPMQGWLCGPSACPCSCSHAHPTALAS